MGLDLAKQVFSVHGVDFEQNDEWQLQRRYQQLEGLQAVGDNQPARLSAVMS